MERGERIQDWNKEFKILNLVVFGKHTENVPDRTYTMNVAASKVSLSMHNMPATTASPCVRAMVSPPKELEFRPRSTQKF